MLATNDSFVPLSFLALDRYDSAHKFVIYALFCLSSFCSLLLLVSTLKLHTPAHLWLPSFPLPSLAVINAPLELTTRFQLHLVNATTPRLRFPSFPFACYSPFSIPPSPTSTHNSSYKRKCHFMHFKCVAVCALSHIMYLYLSLPLQSYLYLHSMFVFVSVFVYLRLCLGVPHIVCQCTWSVNSIISQSGAHIAYRFINRGPDTDSETNGANQKKIIEQFLEKKTKT